MTLMFGVCVDEEMGVVIMFRAAKVRRRKAIMERFPLSLIILLRGLLVFTLMLADQSRLRINTPSKLGRPFRSLILHPSGRAQQLSRPRRSASAFQIPPTWFQSSFSRFGSMCPECSYSACTLTP